MKKIISKHFPFAGYKAMTVWPFIFIREGMAWAYNERSDRHEHIHGEQQKELLVAGMAISCILWLVGCGWWSLIVLPIRFYLWYGIEYLIRWAYYKNRDTAYRNIAFEREAYAKEDDVVYLDSRKPFAWVKYIKNPTLLRDK